MEFLQSFHRNCLKILMEMGHGDELVIADGNFPAVSIAQRLVRSDGNMVPELLEAVLRFFPLDPYVEAAGGAHAGRSGRYVQTGHLGHLQEIIQKFPNKNSAIENVERFAFYERAKKAFAVVATSETSPLCKHILKKGVVIEG